MRDDREKRKRLPNMLPFLFWVCLSPIEKQIASWGPGQAAGKI